MPPAVVDPVVVQCYRTFPPNDRGLPGDKGFIAIDKGGNMALEFNSNLMRRAYRGGEGTAVVAMWKDE